MGAAVTAATWLFGAGGVGLIGIGGYFLALRPALLAEDLSFLGRSGSDIDEAVPRLREWLRLVFSVLGGYAVAAGVLTVFIAATAVREGRSAGVVVLAVAGAVSIGIMAVVNFIIGSTFRWMLLAVAALWVAATIAAAVS